MNIFKILASGDGSINEPNVSAFLGYLLNPKGDHGISDELLKQVLACLYSENKSSSLKDFLIDKSSAVRNLSINSNFDVEILLEQAFTKEGDKKEIVDIVILCFEKEKQQKESLVKMVLSNDTRGALKQVFLIENKIKDSSTRKEQLKSQCLSTITTLAKELKKDEKAIREILSILFISPDAAKSNDEYREFYNDPSTNGIPKIQIHWTADDEQNAENTMIFFLRQILDEEGKGNIEAINEQTKFIIKSFIGFVDNDFKSSIEEEIEGEMNRDVNYDFAEFETKHRQKFSNDAWNIITMFQKKIATDQNLLQRHSPTHPLSIFKNKNGKKDGQKIMCFSRRGKDVYFKIYHNRNEQQKTEMDEFILKMGNIKTNDGDGDGGRTICVYTHDIEALIKIFHKFYSLIK
ncbi:hypothetical protein AGMMS4956_04370 [Bacteroidia bacterium]|nr:hypothetical protein AGMMS4956_04370 [Bacteroidia bacterium]